MSQLAEPCAAPAPADPQTIDRSCRGPVLTFFVSSVVWLLVGTALAMLASIKLHSPGFLTGAGWLSFGRVRPAHLDVVAYGWGAMAGLGCLVWLMCRLCRTEARYPQVLIASAVLWNAGVLSGTVAVLAGRSTGIEWIEFPAASSFLLFAGLVLLGAWTLLTFAQRRQQYVYVSQWYLFATVLWFPWVYATVQLLCVVAPVTGVAQESVHWWFGHNVLGVFFTPVGLAAIYYLIPKVLGRPIYSYGLSLLGFWTLAMFYTWAGGHHLVSGPVPAWLVTVSAVSSMMMFIPVLATAVNFHMTMKGRFSELRTSHVLRFVVFGGIAYTVASVQGSMQSLRFFNEPFHFTHMTIGHAHLGLYGFYTMVMFGAIYFIVPRLTGVSLRPRLVRWHFWTVAIGITLMFLGLTVGGAIQGFEMNHAAAPLWQYVNRHGLWAGIGEFVRSFEARAGRPIDFVTIVRGTIPWLHFRSASGILLTFGHVLFAAAIYKNIRAARSTSRDDPATVLTTGHWPLATDA